MLGGWNFGSIQDLPRLDDTPLVSLDVVRNSHQNPQHAQTLDCHLLPHVVLGTGRPGQEGADVLGELGEGGGGPIVVLNDLVVERSALGTVS